MTYFVPTANSDRATSVHRHQRHPIQNKQLVRINVLMRPTSLFFSTVAVATWIAVSVRMTCCPIFIWRVRPCSSQMNNVQRPRKPLSINHVDVHRCLGRSVVSVLCQKDGGLCSKQRVCFQLKWDDEDKRTLRGIEQRKKRAERRPRRKMNRVDEQNHPIPWRFSVTKLIMKLLMSWPQTVFFSG